MQERSVKGMEVKIGLAKTTKYAMNYCGDSFNMVERPGGGISAILADGQGSGLSAYQTSSWVVNRLSALLTEGGRDEAAVEAVHEELYDRTDRRISCSLTTVSSDFESETVIICRNTYAPVFIWTEDYETVYEEDAGPIGVHRHTKPLMYELPFSPGMVILSCTDGIKNAGKKRMGREADPEKILGFLRSGKAEDAGYLAKSVMEYALSLDHEEAADDMTVMVMGLAEGSEGATKVSQMEISYPI